jgi:hypothetical protein
MRIGGEVGMRDKETVLLDVLSAMADFHESSPLGEAYFDLYQAVGSYVLARDLKPVAEHYKAIREAFDKLPDPDADVIGTLMDAVLGE